MARLLIRLCRLPRAPHERLGLRLTALDALLFDMNAILADQKQAARVARRFTRKRRNAEGKLEYPPAETIAASLLHALYVEG